MKKISRRSLLVQGVAGSAVLLVTGCQTGPKSLRKPSSVAYANDEFDFIVVGAGPGGGPLAARLAQADFRVLLLEAGSDKVTANHKTPALHGLATEDLETNWSYFVKHFSDGKAARRDSKFSERENGIYYPRGSGVGGCSLVNAGIYLAADNDEWSNIQKITKDDSWSPGKMFGHFRRLRKNLSGQKKEFYDAFVADYKKGWLRLTQNSLKFLLEDGELRTIVLKTLESQGLGAEVLQKVLYEDINIKLDPNIENEKMVQVDGLYNPPLAVTDGERRSVREFVLEAKRKHPDNLFIETQALVRKLIFSEKDPTQVIGVKYAKGASLYSADRKFQEAASFKTVVARARHEVILSAGAFNTPQILQLSGIGDKEWLRQKGIDVRVDLPAVGSNLQDRYEISVVTDYDFKFSLLKDCAIGSENDPCMKDYKRDRESHLYGTNGVVAALLARSQPHYKSADLCIFGLPADFRGYGLGWTENLYHPNRFTWVVLKKGPATSRGYVRVRSSNFQERPEINFRSFHDGQAWNGQEIQDIYEGLRRVREINSKIAHVKGGREIYPGPDVRSAKDLKKYILQQSWGHHASCTCPMGAVGDPKAVVDSEFRVQKTKGLRIVDASVFPQIPGLFIMVPILTISEKAAQSLIDQYRFGRK